MVNFLLGIAIGNFLGFILAGLMVASKDEEKSKDDKEE